jgi:uncharacterized protein (TIGR03086 family)
MNRPGGPAALPPDSARLLEQAICYALSAAAAVSPDLLGHPTPCRGWDLRMLLLHACESMAALTEGLDNGSIGLQPGAAVRSLTADPAPILRSNAGVLLGACRGTGQDLDGCDDVVTIGGCPLAAGVLVTTGALEIAVHGWDISQACGRRDPIPDLLALRLLQVAPLLVTTEDRHPLFAAPVSVARDAGPSDQLTAFLGRAPA